MTKFIPYTDTVGIIDEEFNFYLKWCKNEREIEIVSKAFDEIKKQIKKLSNVSFIDEEEVMKHLRENSKYTERLEDTIKTLMEVYVNEKSNT